MNIFVDISCEDPGWGEEQIVPLATYALRAEGAPENCEVSVSLITEDEIAELNEQYRGIARPTDVLSFPMDEVDDESEEQPELPIGDIMIAPSVVRAQAGDFGNTFDEEMSLMLVHGCLHLLGYDHIVDEEAEVMEAHERVILESYREGRSSEDVFAEMAREYEEADGDDIDDYDDDGEDLVEQFFSTSAVKEGFKSGFVTLVGRPNVGKSTLVNAIVGEKVAITSSTAQTTRHRLRAIYDTDDYQMVLVDTPGLHKPHDALGEELNFSTEKALEEVDVAAMLIDATMPVGRGDAWVANMLASAKIPKILVITKADLADAATVDAQIAAARELGIDFDDVIVLSALEGFNVDGFTAAVANLLPEGPRWFPEDMRTDQPIEVIIAEFIREKVLRSTFDEVPHSVGVQVDDLEFDDENDCCRVAAVIYCERESQKGIIIGKGGKMVKKIGTEARRDLCKLLGQTVHLNLLVKVKQDWRRDATQIRRFGYGTGL